MSYQKSSPDKNPLATAQGIGQPRLRAFQHSLLKWQAEHGLEFPWRKTRNPYHILISEFLLQKTNRRAVPKIYQEFVSKYPTPASVAAASVADLEAIVAPLGLTYRAQRILDACLVIAERYENEVPRDSEALQSLKGIGRYIASSILLFAFSEPVGLVDTNIVRVLGRVFEVRSTKSRSHSDPELWKAADELVPPKEAREYNLAIIDLSALVCRPKPKCSGCPLASICTYRQGQLQSGI